MPGLCVVPQSKNFYSDDEDVDDDKDDNKSQKSSGKSGSESDSEEEIKPAVSSKKTVRFILSPQLQTSEVYCHLLYPN